MAEFETCVSTSEKQILDEDNDNTLNNTLDNDNNISFSICSLTEYFDGTSLVPSICTN